MARSNWCGNPLHSSGTFLPSNIATGDPGCFQSTEDIFLVADDAERGDVPLRFPPFHKEILQQPHWEPGESVGRIKVIISEGVLRGTSPPATSHPKFDRLRDVIAFSFQHAPQSELI